MTLTSSCQASPERHAGQLSQHHVQVFRSQAAIAIDVMDCEQEAQFLLSTSSWAECCEETHKLLCRASCWLKPSITCGPAQGESKVYPHLEVDAVKESLKPSGERIYGQLRNIQQLIRRYITLQ